MEKGRRGAESWPRRGVVLGLFGFRIRTQPFVGRTRMSLNGLCFESLFEFLTSPV